MCVRGGFVCIAMYNSTGYLRALQAGIGRGLTLISWTLVVMLRYNRCSNVLFMNLMGCPFLLKWPFFVSFGLFVIFSLLFFLSALVTGWCILSCSDGWTWRKE